MSKTTAYTVKMSSISTPWGRKIFHMQLPALFSNFRFHGQIWQFCKSARISKTPARRAKISLILNPWGRKRAHMQLWDLSKQPLCFLLSCMPKIGMQILNLPANSVFQYSNCRHTPNLFLHSIRGPTPTAIYILKTHFKNILCSENTHFFKSLIF